VRKAIRAATIGGSIYPVLCGSAFKNKGIQQLLEAVVEYLPSPVDRGAVAGTDPESGEEIQRRPDTSEPFSCLVFKVATDQHTGRLAFVRAYSGRATTKDLMLNPRTGNREKVSRIFRMRSNRRKPVQSIEAGEILALVGLKDTTTGDSLCDRNRPVCFESVDFPEPVVSRSIEPKSASDEEKLKASLERLVDEDPTCSVRVDPETGQRLISGMGELHLEVLVDRLVREFGVEAHVGKPQVSYRESVTGKAEERAEITQPIGGKMQYAAATLSVSPIVPPEANEFKSAIDDQDIPEAYVAAVKQGIDEASSGGEMAGYPVTGVSVLLRELEIREDTTEMACKIVGSMAFRQACMKAVPALLEPVMTIEVVAPEEYVGAVIHDLNGRRGKVMGMAPRRDQQVVDAEVPLAEMFGYATALRSLTQGRALYSMQFDRYEQAGKRVQEEILKRIGR
jgi:elongation factor G